MTDARLTYDNYGYDYYRTYVMFKLSQTFTVAASLRYHATNATTPRDVVAW